MLNVILDGFPDEYEGYLIRTDFRIGMQISEALKGFKIEAVERQNNISNGRFKELIITNY